MQKSKSYKFTFYLTALCCMVYAASYFTRNNFSAVISAIVVEEGFAKSAVSFVTTAGFVSYGIGQLISGYMGDHIDSKKMIFFGLILTAICNFCIPLSPNIHIMTAIWFINGFAQAFMWPPLIKIASMYLSRVKFEKTIVGISIVSSCATISIYLISPVIINFFGYKTVFLVSGIIGISSAIIWVTGINHLLKNKKTAVCTSQNNEETAKASSKIFIKSGIIFVIVAIILQGMLRDGITTWMPSYILETFHLSSSFSILITVLLPVFSVFAFKIAEFLHKKYFDNEMLCASVIFGVGFLSTILLAALFNFTAGISVVLASTITGCMSGVNLLLLCMLPARFKKYGNISSISGILNFFTYLGSAASTYIFAKLSETLGWQFTIVFWVIIAFIGTVFCLLNVKRWKKFCKM